MMKNINILILILILFGSLLGQERDTLCYFNPADDIIAYPDSVPRTIDPEYFTKFSPNPEKYFQIDSVMVLSFDSTDIFYLNNVELYDNDGINWDDSIGYPGSKIDWSLDWFRHVAESGLVTTEVPDVVQSGIPLYWFKGVVQEKAYLFGEFWIKSNLSVTSIPDSGFQRVYYVPYSGGFLKKQIDLPMKVYITYTDSVVGITKNDLIPESPIFMSNYPNPFNSSTTISWSTGKQLNETGTLNIYNLKGIKIYSRKIDNKINHYSWDGTLEDGLIAPSGSYIVTISYKDFYESTTITLIK